MFFQNVVFIYFEVFSPKQITALVVKGQKVKGHQGGSESAVLVKLGDNREQMQTLKPAAHTEHTTDRIHSSASFCL